MINKDFCCSSYLAFRYIEDDNMNFFDGLNHQNINPISNEKKILVKTSKDIDEAIKKQFEQFKGKKLGIMLSGGMDSAILASYMPGCDAYTFRFLNGKFQQFELEKAEYYAKYYGLKLHYVDINWEDTVEKNLDIVMKRKNAPVHSIEPQLYQGAMQAKKDGVEVLVVGESSDLVFGGMDGLLAKDWTFDEFVKRYTFLDPYEVLNKPVSMNYLFERYRQGNYIDFQKFMDDVFSIESSSSYFNAFGAANMEYFDPYAILKMAEKLDLNRVRNGEPKYLIRELFSMKYPEMEIPNKTPMPRPVDEYFKNWNGPKRTEFRDDIDLSSLSGNQKWQLFCLERFLNLYEKNN